MIFAVRGPYFVMNKTSISLFNCRSDAEPIQKRLREANIAADLHDCSHMKGARLDVPTDKFEQAYGLLQKWDAAEGGIRGAIRCPECNSFRVDFPQYTHKSALPNLLIGLLANIHVLPKEFYCHDCHFTWPRAGTRPSRVRPHMAPYYFIEGVAQPQPPEHRHAA
jgi:hypothetical protein